jgi:hypothetical protein
LLIILWLLVAVEVVAAKVEAAALVVLELDLVFLLQSQHLMQLLSVQEVLPAAELLHHLLQEVLLHFLLLLQLVAAVAEAVQIMPLKVEAQVEVVVEKHLFLEDQATHHLNLHLKVIMEEMVFLVELA